MNVTGIPAHTGFEDEVIETLTGCGVMTTIVMIFEAAGLPEVQVRSDVIITHIFCPFEGI